MTIAAFPSVEVALKDVIDQWYPGKVGGDLSFEAGEGFYIAISLIDGRADRLSGDWVFDIDIFADDYATASSLAGELEAKLLDGPHRAGGMIIDEVYQNTTARPEPWEDDNVTRLGAVYGFSSRRSG